MNQSILIDFEFDNEKLCKTIENSIDLTSNRKKIRSDSNIKRIGKNMSLTITSKDKTSLRAAVNSTLRWVSMVEDISIVINNKNNLKN